MKRPDIDSKKQEIIDLLDEGTPVLEVCSILDCRYSTLNARLKIWNYDLKNPARKNKFDTNNIKYIPASEYLGTNKQIKTHRLKLKLIREGIKEHKCEMCGITEWNEKPTPIELDHINGINDDNRLENLRILCPNCHAQTENYCGKNIRVADIEKECEYCESIFIAKSNKRRFCSIGCASSRKRTRKKQKQKEKEKNKKCTFCKTEYHSKNKNSKFCSTQCAANSRIKKEITKEELEKLIWEIPTTKIAEKFGISDVAVAKRCKHFGIEKPPRGYWAKVNNGCTPELESRD